MEINKKQKKEYWITNSRFRFIAVIILIMWLAFLGVIYLKYDAITNDPCTICAEYMGEEVSCTLFGYESIRKVYYPDGDIQLIE